MNKEWVESTLGDVARVNPESAANWDVDREIQYVDIASVSADRGIDVDAVSKFRFAEAPGRARRVLRRDDVIVSTVRPNLRAFAVVPESLDGQVGSTGLAVIRATAHVEPGFIWAVVTSEQFVNDMVSKCTGSNYPAVRPADVAAHIFALPPLSTQRRIVAVIDSIDRQIDATNAERDASTSMVGALRTRLGDGEDQIALVEMAAPKGIQIGPFGSQLHAHEYVDEGIPVVMPQDIVDGKITESKIKRVDAATASRLAKHRLLPGDIVFPRRGDLNKRALVSEAQEGWICGTGCLRFRAKDTGTSKRAFEAISNQKTTDWLNDHAVGTTMLNLNTSILSALPVPVFRDEMTALADACADAATVSDALQREGMALRATRTAVLNAFLSREIEIPESFDKLLAEKVAV